MRPNSIVALVLAICAIAAGPACAPQAVPSEEMEMSMNLSSMAFSDGEEMPTKYTCDGQDVSPPLAWEEGPEGTVAYALLLKDPDAPGGIFTHWVLFNIPSHTRELPEAVPIEPRLPNGAIQGQNDFGATGYRGPCPPAGSVHRYQFTVYALDEEVELEAGSRRAEVLDAMEGHILAQGQLTGLYKR